MKTRTLKRWMAACLACVAMSAQAQTATEHYEGTTLADEGAWCWFADPRALHYKNTAGTINSSYFGYIDVHGAVKATQVDITADGKARKRGDVLVRSYFQPDDHNNPTFLVLPDERIMIFYTRHTDEPRIWYRISQKPGDITQLGEEKYIKVANNTTYPSPFILSDDPQHIYICWRGIGWHPTIARITMPDQNDNVTVDYGPYQMVQSTGARPYAKYQSNGKDKIYLCYTTGHPDNEMPNWLYFNVVDINKGNGAILRDINGRQLSVIANGKFNVNKTDGYASSYPATIVDRTSGVRNWVWQIALDKQERPVIAQVHLDDARTTHQYWYAKWTGTAWQTRKVADAGHAFHQNWNQTERCYSGGMSLDPDDTNTLYLSIPTKDGAYNKDGVYEIWKYTMNDAGTAVAAREQVTYGSQKNNARPFVLPGSKESPLRLGWMNGDYYYWMVNKNYPKGYPTSVRVNCELEQDAVNLKDGLVLEYAEKNQTPDYQHATSPGERKTYSFNIYAELAEKQSLGDPVFVRAIDKETYEQNTQLSTFSREQACLELWRNADNYLYLKVGDKTYASQNRFLTSDNWASNSTGTSGDTWPTYVGKAHLSLTYDGQQLTLYRDGQIDIKVDVEGLDIYKAYLGGWQGTAGTVRFYDRALSQAEVQASIADLAMQSISVPEEVRTDIVLPTLGGTVSWASSDEDIITPTGLVTLPATETPVTLTATSGSGVSRTWTVKVMPRDITKNCLYETTDIDLTANTLTGFSTNKYETAPQGMLTSLRSYTFLLRAKAKNLNKQPRFYDFGSGSGNSVFLRANPLAAGIKYNGGTTTMVNGTTTLAANKEYKLAVTFDAATKTTRIFIDGVENAAGTANQTEPWQLAELALDTRNYIGRTQWWDSSYASDNADYCGTIDDFRLYDIALTRKEICELQGIPFKDKDLPTALTNGNFEGTYTVMQGSGVSSDRAIYQPEGWSIDYASPNNNDLTVLKVGDLYFNDFFSSFPAPTADSKQTYWVRQKWGASTITLFQELRLPSGAYTLEVDVWKSGQGGDALVSVETEGKSRLTAPSLENKDAWQKASVAFTSDGEASTTILLSAMHNSDGSEKFIGFDNVALLTTSVGISENGSTPLEASQTVYDLNGRRLSPSALKKGVYIRGGKKLVIR